MKFNKLLAFLQFRQTTVLIGVLGYGCWYESKELDELEIGLSRGLWVKYLENVLRSDKTDIDALLCYFSNPKILNVILPKPPSCDSLQWGTGGEVEKDRL